MREFAKVSEIKAGDKVEPDGGFPCMREGSHLEVKVDPHGDLCVECDHGLHTIAEQDDGDGIYIGLYRAEE